MNTLKMVGDLILFHLKRDGFPIRIKDLITRVTDEYDLYTTIVRSSLLTLIEQGKLRLDGEMLVSLDERKKETQDE